MFILVHLVSYVALAMSGGSSLRSVGHAPNLECWPVLNVDSDLKFHHMIGRHVTTPDAIAVEVEDKRQANT
jgi:hypothetical protein